MPIYAVKAGDVKVKLRPYNVVLALPKIMREPTDQFLARTVRTLEFTVIVPPNTPIKVKGNIVSIPTGDTLKIQVFKHGKVPEQGDAPDYETQYTAAGAINVNWQPPEPGSYFIRFVRLIGNEINQWHNIQFTITELGCPDEALPPPPPPPPTTEVESAILIYYYISM